MSNPTTLISTPFAAAGDKNTIQEAVPLEPNNPTWEAGFPVITSTPVSEGGLPPKRLDFNGVLNAVTENIVHQTKGLGYEFDATYATKIGGYPLHAEIMLTNGDIVKSTVANNINDPNVDMGGWVDVNYASRIKDDSGKTQQEINDVIKNQKYLDVRILGIFPHPELDQTLLINQADSFAKQNNIGLYFPSGVYRGFGLLPTTSWVGVGSSETIIKSNGTINATDGFCRLSDSTRPILFEDINFDSNVNPDPVDWQDVFHSHFIGGAAFAVGNSQNVTFNRVKFSNSKFSCLRVTSSSNIIINNCIAQRARGHSGDGVYFNNCNSVIIQNLTVRDVTRIGVVFENNTKNCTVLNSTVTYAHHASVDLGGTEYNAGFWAENSSHIYYDNCVADDVNKMGFVNTNGTGLLGVARSKFTLNNCRVVGEVQYGFWCNTNAASVPADHLLVNCETTFACVAISPGLDHTTDRLIVRDSNFAIGGTKLNRVGLLVSISTMRSSNQLPTMHLENVTVTHVDFDLTKYEDATSNLADLTFFDGMNMDTTLKNVRNTNSDISLYIKSREVASKSNINSTLHVIDSVARFPVFTVSGGVIIDGGSVSGPLSASDIKVRRITNSQRLILSANYVEVSDSVFDFNEQTAYLRLESLLSSKKVQAKFINCKFYKDVTAFDYSLRLQLEGTIKPTVIISQCDFYSKSTTPAGTPLAHIWAVRAGTNVVFSGSFYDSHAIPMRIENTITPTPIEGLRSLDLH